MPHVQSASVWPPTGTGPYTLAFGSNVVSGNLLLVVMFWDPNTSLFEVTTVTDTVLTSYTRAGTTAKDATNRDWTTVFWGIAPSSGANTVTVNFAGALSATHAIMAVAEYSGVTALDQFAKIEGGTTTSGANGTSGPAITPSSNAVDTIAVVTDTSGINTIAPGTGYTERQDVGNSSAGQLQFEDIAATPGSAQTPTWTITTAAHRMNAITISLLSSVVAAPTPSVNQPKKRGLLVVGVGR